MESIKHWSSKVVFPEEKSGNKLHDMNVELQFCAVHNQNHIWSD